MKLMTEYYIVKVEGAVREDVEPDYDLSGKRIAHSLNKKYDDNEFHAIHIDDKLLHTTPDGKVVIIQDEYEELLK